MRAIRVTGFVEPHPSYWTERVARAGFVLARCLLNSFVHLSMVSIVEYSFEV
jgi:hypothetical protein